MDSSVFLFRISRFRLPNRSNPVCRERAGDSSVRTEALNEKFMDSVFEYSCFPDRKFTFSSSYIVGFKAAEIIVATGPKRRLLENSRLPVVFGGPLGDNMMTGTVGVLEAIRRRKGFEPIPYL